MSDYVTAPSFFGTSPVPLLNMFTKWAWVLLLSCFVYLLVRALNMMFSMWSKKIRPPIDAKLPSLSNPHWLLGHLSFLSGSKGAMGLKTLTVDNADKNGISTFWLVNNPAVSFLQPKDAQRVLRGSITRANSSSIFTKHMDNFLGRESILTLPGGTKWKVSRSVVHRAFTPDALTDAQACMNTLAGIFSSSIVQAIDERFTKKISKDNGYMGISPDGEGIVLDYITLFKMVTIDVIGNAAFGYDFQCSKTLTSSYYSLAFEYLQKEFANRIQKDLLNPFTWFYSLPTPRNLKQKKSATVLREFLLNIVHERRMQHATNKPLDKRNLLDYLIDASDSEKLTDSMLSDSLLTLLAAGYETSSITLSYAAYLLAADPRIDQLCAEEARKALGEPGSPIPKDLDPSKDLVYCRAVIYEALRLFPPAVMTQRSLEKPMKLENGITLPSGTNVFLPIYWIQRDAKNFPDPERCAPERWATRSSVGEKWAERLEEGDQENNVSDTNKIELPPANRDAFLAFSAGARSCVGRRFAMQETAIVLAACVRDLKFEVVDGYVLEHKRGGVTYSPANGMPLITKKREYSKSCTF